MMLEEAQQLIEAEFSAARKARQAGNEGMLRVCVRRAAGVAIRFWLEARPQKGWSGDAMTRLKRVIEEGSFPREVRDAAHRLTARVTQDFTSAHAADPMDDARVIIRHLLGTASP